MIKEQLDSVTASAYHSSAYHYRVTFKPEAILNTVDIRTTSGNNSK